MYPWFPLLHFWPFMSIINASLKSSTLFPIFILCAFRAKYGVKLTYKTNSHAEGNIPYKFYFLDEVQPLVCCGCCNCREMWPTRSIKEDGIKKKKQWIPFVFQTLDDDVALDSSNQEEKEKDILPWGFHKMVHDQNVSFHSHLGNVLSRTKCVENHVCYRFNGNMS
jgi:hypothetical protein